MSQKIKYAKFESKRNFGIELEINNTVAKHRIKNIIRSACNRRIEVSFWGKDTGNTYWHVKDDASCGPKGLDGPKGYEIASYVGSGLRDIIHMTDVTDLLHEKKVGVTQFCGLHIHADGSDLTPEQVGTIIAYWLKIEHVIGLSLPCRRRGNIFCRNLRGQCRWYVAPQNLYTPTQVWDYYKPQDLSDQDNDDRRVNFNLVNYARGMWYHWWKRKTLELRWPEGTLDGRNVKNWLRLYLNFIDNVKDKPMPATLESASIPEALQILGLHHNEDEFTVLSEGLMETKTWLLERIWYFVETERWYGGREKDRWVKQAKTMLNHMWSPVKKYASLADIYPYNY